MATSFGKEKRKLYLCRLFFFVTNLETRTSGPSGNFPLLGNAESGEVPLTSLIMVQFKNKLKIGRI